MPLLNFRRKQPKKSGEERSKSGKERSKAIPFAIPLWNFKSYDGQLLLIDTIVACVDALARNIAKMDLKAIKREKDTVSITDTTSDVARVLRRPNPYMTEYDFLYKVTAMLFTTNNVFIWPQYENGKLVALWPINYQFFNLYKTEEGVLVAQFNLSF